MKMKAALEKWAVGVLGVVCLLLIFNMFRGGAPAAQEKVSASPARAKDALHAPAFTLEAKDELSRYNPEVKLDLLSDIQQRELPSLERNPFEFPKPKEPAPWVGPRQPQKNDPGSTEKPTVTLNIKLIGFSEKAGGLKEGIVSDEDGIYVVHEGETFNKRYKVNKLTSASATIYDDETHQTVELPLAQ